MTDSNPQFNRILILDDEKLIVEYLQEGFADEDYVAISFIHSSDAMNYLKEHQVDIVLTDLKMPIFSGIEIGRFAKKQNPDCEVIILTGFASLDSAIDAIRFDVYDYIRKPFEMNDVLNVVNNAREKMKIQHRNATLTKNLNRMVDELTMLHDISKIMYQSSNPELVAKFITATIKDVLGVENAGIFINEENEFHNYLLIDNSFQLNDIIEYHLSDAIHGDLFSTTDVLTIDLSEDSTFGHLPDFRSIQIFPVKFDGNLIAVLGLFHNESEGLKKESQLLLQILCNQIAPLVDKLIQQRIGDKNTLIGDKKFQKYIEEEIQVSRNADNQFSLLLLEVLAIQEAFFELDIDNLNQQLEAVVQSAIGSAARLHWIAPHIAILLLPGQNNIGAQFSALKIGEMIREFFTLEENIRNREFIQTSTVSYPQNGSKAEKLVRELWQKFYRIHRKD